MSPGTRSGSEAPAAALAGMPALAGARLRRRLRAGPVADTWSLAQGERTLVLKVDRLLAGPLGIDRQLEYRVLEQVGVAGLGPSPVAVDARHGWLVVESLPGAPAQADVSELAQLLARLHHLPAGDLPELDLVAAAARYCQLGGLSPDSRLMRQFVALQENLPAPSGLVLCHNDVHPGNLWRSPDGVLRLVDWEYARLGPAAFELAIAAAESGIGPETLLAAYVEAGGDAGISPAALSPWVDCYRLLRELWLAAVSA